ncbi:Programmed cell death protein 10 [Aphelenchoides fujianensis]|nr:Programmed cell death protein 10 [Aphelenchoides fujianensis]
MQSEMDAEEGVGYLAPVTFHCLFRPALEKIKTARSNDPEAVEAIDAVQQAFFQADKDSPSFLFDLTRLLIKESQMNINIQESYLRMQANASTDDLELRELGHVSKYALISERAIHLRRVLARIPDEMADRRPFLETIKEIAASIRDLLDVANEIVKNVPPTIHPVIEKRKREFVHYSKRFSNTLKEYFRDHDASQVFVASNLLIFQTIHLIRSIRERVQPAMLKDGQSAAKSASKSSN